MQINTGAGNHDSGCGYLEERKSSNGKPNMVEF